MKADPSSSSSSSSSPADLFRKLMNNNESTNLSENATQSNDSSSSFYVSISKRLDTLDAVLARDKSSGILTEKDENQQPLLFTFLHSIIKFISKCF
jgi:hypothetical protein